MEFELTFFEAADQHFSRNNKGTIPFRLAQSAGATESIDRGVRLS